MVRPHGRPLSARACETRFEAITLALSRSSLFRRAPLATGILLCGLAAPLAAQPLGLDTLTISAPSVESTAVAEMARYGSHLNIIEREQIERAGPSADLSRVLQMYVPGLYVAPKNGPFDTGTFSLLGGRNDDTLILLDGVRLNNRLYGGIYLDTLPTTAVERIEVLKGGQGILFGTQAVSGVINIVTRRPQSRDASGEVNLGLDSFKGRNGDARVERVLTNGFGDLGLLGYASRHRSQGYQPYRDRDMTATVSDERRSYDVITLGGKAIQAFGEDARLELFYQYSEADLDFARPTSNRSTTNDRIHQIATATFQQRLSDDFSWFAKTHINDWDTRYTRIYNLQGGGTRTLNRNDYWGFTDWGAQIEGKAILAGGHELVFGNDNQWFEGQDDVLIIDNNEAEAHAFYAQLRPRIDALPDWHPSLGMRREKMSGGEGATVWMLTSLYDLNEQWKLRGQFGTAFKLPNAEQLYVNEPGSEMGNPDLKPERSRNAELGLDFDGGPLTASATLFRRDITDLISLHGEQWVNGDGEIEVRGVEVDAQWRFAPGWSWSGDATRNLIETREGVTLHNIPSFFARTRLGYDADAWGVGAAARYVRAVVSAAGDDYGHYTVLDADAYRYLDAAQQHRVSLLLENLLDRDYATSRITNGTRQVDSLGRPRTAELRYTYRF